MESEASVAGRQTSVVYGVTTITQKAPFLPAPVTIGPG